MAELSAAHRETLLEVARRSVDYGLSHKTVAPLGAHSLPFPLKRIQASFVTLKIEADLRGCIGTLDAVRPLVVDVHENAYAAAFRDPRFAPLSGAEWNRVRLSLSILSVPEAMDVRSEAELLDRLRPGIDGLVLEYGARRSTFLPVVWESLPDRADFVRQLKLKAGLPADFWAEGICVYRYGATSIEEEG